MAEGVDEKGRVLHYDYAEHAGEQEASECTLPYGKHSEEVIVSSGKDGWADETDKQRDPLNVFVLPHDETIFDQIVDVIIGFVRA